MNFFRTHIARLSGFVMLMVGMALHYAVPDQQKTDHNAFTSWLGSHLKSNDDNVLNKIDALTHDDAALDTVIRKASELVADHLDDFKLPVSEEEQEVPEDVYHVLLSEWNQYRSSGNTMGSAVLIENVKPQTILPTDGYTLHSTLNKQIASLETDLRNELYLNEFNSVSSHILSPMKSGTAIGAP